MDHFKGCRPAPPVGAEADMKAAVWRGFAVGLYANFLQAAL